MIHTIHSAIHSVEYIPYGTKYNTKTFNMPQNTIQNNNCHTIQYSVYNTTHTMHEIQLIPYHTVQNIIQYIQPNANYNAMRITQSKIPYSAMPYCTIPCCTIHFHAVPYSAIPYPTTPHQTTPSLPVTDALLLSDLTELWSTQMLSKSAWPKLLLLCERSVGAQHPNQKKWFGWRLA